MDKKLILQAIATTAVLIGVKAGPPTAYAEAEADPVPQVVSVTFSGSQTVGEAYVRSVVRTTAGQPFDEATVNEDVQRLLRTGKFLSVNLATASTPEGVAVTFHLVDRPVVTAIRIVGNVK
ncbi:MAG: POTRA domain-containing protein [Planctomycetota bacterium]